MAESEILIKWDATPTDFTLTSLASLASDDMWQSGEINDATPTYQIVSISYELDTVSPGAGDHLAFYIAKGDEASSNEIWSGGIGTSIGQITTAAAVAEVQASIGIPAHIHAFQTNHGVEFKGLFNFWFFGPSWQLIVHTVGMALAASTHRLRYRYGTPAAQ